MEFFKKTFSWTMLLIMVCSMSFISCSSDDDEEGGSTGVKQCYIKIDGKQKNFKYAYYYGDEYGDDIEFTDIDILYYYKNPDKIKKGTMFSWAVIYSTRNFVSGTTTNYEFEYSPEEDLYANRYEDEDERPLESYYCSPDEENHTPINISVNDDYYIIDAPEMKLELIDESISYSPIGEATADFYFEGTLQDMSFMLEDEVMTVIKVDKPTMQWLKNIRTKNK